MKTTIVLLPLLIAFAPGCAFFQQQSVDRVGDYLAHAEDTTELVCTDLSAPAQSKDCEKAKEALRNARMLAERLGQLLPDVIDSYKNVKELSKSK